MNSSRSRMLTLRNQMPMSADSAARKLDAALELEHIEIFMATLEEVIKAQGGMSAAARAAGLNRTALYKVVSARGNPALSTLTALLAAVDLRLSIKPLNRGTVAEASGIAIVNGPTQYADPTEQ